MQQSTDAVGGRRPTGALAHRGGVDGGWGPAAYGVERGSRAAAARGGGGGGERWRRRKKGLRRGLARPAT